MVSRFLKTVRNCPGKIFFFIVLLIFSTAQAGAVPTGVPFKTELHEKATPRVSKHTCRYQTTFYHFKRYIRSDYGFALASSHLRISHRLKIHKNRKSKFNRYNGLLHRLPTDDEPFSLQV